MHTMRETERALGQSSSDRFLVKEIIFTNFVTIISHSKTYLRHVIFYDYSEIAISNVIRTNKKTK